jgi:malate synthase
MTVTSPVVDPFPPDRLAAGGLLRAGLTVPLAAWTTAAQGLLIPELQDLLERLHRELEPERARLLLAREARQERWNRGERPGYLPDDELPEAHGDWRIAPLPSDLLRRRVEITGPICDLEAIVGMLSRSADGARADAAMLDFEDSMKPSWGNVLQGLVNLVGAAAGTLSCTRPASEDGAEREVVVDFHDRPLLMVRVRGLHLAESNVEVDGEPISAGLFDFVSSAYWTARTLLDQGRTPKYYVPKCEHHLEARWWNRLFSRVEEELDLPARTIKSTFLIETLPAAFQMDEILYQVRDHVAGLSVGGWDKIASDIKVLHQHPDRILADRATVGMERPWLRSHALQLISVCHRHGAFAIGGMAAFTPGQTAERRAEQAARVRAEEDLEFALGHDGCLISHPCFLKPAFEAFPRDHQLDVLPEIPARPQLLPEACGPRTLAGLRTNVRFAIAYLRGWNDDVGCVAWDDRIEDLATLEVARAQTWQWLRHGTALEGPGLESGQPVTVDRVRRIFAEEQARIELELAEKGADAREIEAYRKARLDAETLFTEPDFRAFLVTASDPAGLNCDVRRARLRGDEIA